MLVLVTHSFPRIHIWSLSDAVIGGYFDQRLLFPCVCPAANAQELGQRQVFMQWVSTKNWHSLSLPSGWRFCPNLIAYNLFLREESNILQVHGFGDLCKMSPIELMSWIHKSPNFKPYPQKKHKGLLQSLMIIHRMTRSFHTKTRLSPQSHCSLVHLQCDAYVQLTQIDISDHSMETRLV